MKIKTMHEGSEYAYLERGTSALLLRDGEIIWWGTVKDTPPIHLAPRVVLLDLSVKRAQARCV